MDSYRVDIAFNVEASSPAMAIRKLFNALSLTLGEDYMTALNGCVGIAIGPDGFGHDAPVDTSISLDDPRLIAGAYMGASHVEPVTDTTYEGVAQ